MYSTATLSNSALQAFFLPSPASSSSPYCRAPQASLPPHRRESHEGAPAQSGLRTPPTDENMGTTYQMPNMASYENHHLQHHSAYAPAVAPSDRLRPALNERPTPNEQVFNPSSRCSSQTQAQQPTMTLPHPRMPVSSSSIEPSTTHPAHHQSKQTQQPISRQSTRSSTPILGGAVSDQELSTRDSAMVLHSLQIPQCISPKGGNLADFVAELTALFWFESIHVLEAADKIRTIPQGAPVRRMAESAKASRHFKKWVQSVLTTTQVTQNVILLALLFIYRLKVINPVVKGRQGSEYRLFTVALMLGNKFLDDNTYTNKTWADVSGISVNEIHVMEVEFLSNMRYSLLASKEEWEEWLSRLGRLWEYLERAQRASPSPLLIPSPTNRTFVSPLPSPTGTLQLASQSLGVYSPSPSTSFVGNHANGNGGSSWPSYASNNAVSPLALKPEPGLLPNRKRSFPEEEDPTEPPAKRASRTFPPQPQPHPMAQQQHAPHGVHPHSQIAPQAHQAPHRPTVLPPTQPRPPPAVAPDHGRLSVPSLTLNTTHGPPLTGQSYPAVSYAPPQASPLSLPPLVPGLRAMSTVFPPSANTYSSPHPVLPSSGPGLPSHPASVTPTTTYPPTNYGTPTKRLSPQNALTPTAPYPGSSPLTDSFHHHAGTPIAHPGSASGVHTPISHSPSIYLQQRNSPYKPVRHVNTLLYPPPSAFLQQYHFANTLPPTQMHYQPLGRRNEFRTGIVPEFAMARAGHQGPVDGQHHAVTPVPYQPMPQVLPNPAQGRQPYAPPMARPMPLNHSYN